MSESNPTLTSVSISVDLDLWHWIEDSRGTFARSTYLRSIILAYKEGHLKGKIKIDYRGIGRRKGSLKG